MIWAHSSHSSLQHENDVSGPGQIEPNMWGSTHVGQHPCVTLFSKNGFWFLGKMVLRNFFRTMVPMLWCRLQATPQQVLGSTLGISALPPAAPPSSCLEGSTWSTGCWKAKGVAWIQPKNTNNSVRITSSTKPQWSLTSQKPNTVCYARSGSSKRLWFVESKAGSLSAHMTGNQQKLCVLKFSRNVLYLPCSWKEGMKLIVGLWPNPEQNPCQ